MGVRGLTLPFYPTRLGLRAGLHYWCCRMHISSPAGRLKMSRREFCGGSGVSARPPTDSSLATPRVKKHSGRISNDEGQLASYTCLSWALTPGCGSFSNPNRTVADSLRMFFLEGCFPTKVRTGLKGSHYSNSCLGL